MRISEVVKETGVSRELIHHYLRQGLLPQPKARGVYTKQQIDLLRLLKKLREDHQLPLELIRQAFETFNFDQVRLAPFTLTHSLNKRMEHLVAGNGILSSTLSQEEILSQTGISAERLKDYIQAKLVCPYPNDDQEMFSLYDANVIFLCEKGIEIGMPFESFRTIGAYVRIGFELEHGTLFMDVLDKAKEEKKIQDEIFIRQEVVTSLIQNLLQSLICLRLMDFAALPPQGNGSLETIIYRPSPMFCQRYGIDQAIEAAQESLSHASGVPKHWHTISELMLHAGRYHEANLFLEQALEKWPKDNALLVLQGKALVLSGLHDRGIKVIKKCMPPEGEEALCPIYLALSLFTHPDMTEKGAKALLSRTARHTQASKLIDEALALADRGSLEVRIETSMIAGWLLTAISTPSGNEAKGAALLVKILRELEKTNWDTPLIPGLRQRYLINTAYLLLRCLKHAKTLRKDKKLSRIIPLQEDLNTLICSLDPGSNFAEQAFLSNNIEERNSHEKTSC